MEVRLIKLSYQNRARKKAPLILVTTFLDPIKHNSIELADLYARRWDIELKLRDLKTTLKMEFFAVKSPEMAHKTMWMSLIAFNLIRVTKLIDIQPFRSEQQAVKRRPKNHPLLNAPRHEYVEVFHR